MISKVGGVGLGLSKCLIYTYARLVNLSLFPSIDRNASVAWLASGSPEDPGCRLHPGWRAQEAHGHTHTLQLACCKLYRGQ